MEGGGEGRGGERRTFPVSEDTVLVQALELASKAKEVRWGQAIVCSTCIIAPSPSSDQSCMYVT